MGKTPFALVMGLWLAGLVLPGCRHGDECRSADCPQDYPDSLMSAARARLESLSPQATEKPTETPRMAKSPFAPSKEVGGWNDRLKRASPEEASAFSTPRKPAKPSATAEPAEKKTAKSAAEDEPRTGKLQETRNSRPPLPPVIDEPSPPELETAAALGPPTAPGKFSPDIPPPPRPPMLQLDD